MWLNLNPSRPLSGDGFFFAREQGMGRHLRRSLYTVFRMCKKSTKVKIMDIYLKALDASGELVLETRTPIDATHLVTVAESRVELAQSKGRDFMQGAIPFYASELLRAAFSGTAADEVESMAINTAMSAWLVDSVFDGVSEDEFVNSDLHFTRLANGAVRYTRVPTHL